MLRKSIVLFFKIGNFLKKMFDLTDKVVVITGGAGKLGQKHPEAGMSS